jgi:hypothetical protein
VLGGVAASRVGPPTAIGGALALAAAFSLWSFVTTPHEAKHLARPRRSDRPPAEARSVIDLTTLEPDVGPLARPSAQGELASAV